MGDLSAEPSMEDILSSIKRIIAEENDAAPGRAKRPARTLPARSDPAPFGHDEILELSEPAPEPEPDHPVPAQAEASIAVAPPPIAGPADSILSERTAVATRGPLDALSRMIVKPEVAGSDTLEGMVREMLRPMLRDWLDANLPPMVETMVAREIERITNK
ncbi:DUF2497 domain-containing protein [Sphingomonas psychrolutea]|uniref:Pole-organizing protein PopZ n=1 Tax=Sphingomonas psychrolutea TaxID=1259676 RepID=A0ABQ1GR95_9SPHN|nr:DUF2497 domain-containing protein [Sphingomonas psychrolutea]GGA48839.1 pole-organizing protein PopZ [Sphingomonas psychrolutea]